MTHALRQNCGSFLYDSISREWLSEEERQAFDRGDLKSHTSETTGATMGDIEESVSGLPKEWPLFDSPVLSSVRVTGFVEKNGIAYFTVCPVLGGFQWTVLRTYQQFVDLHKVLVSLYGVDRQLLPSRGVLGFFAKLKKGELMETQGVLEGMLMAVVQNCPVAPTELFKFLEYPFCDVLSVTQGLARFFYQQGDVVIAQDKAVQMSPLQLHCMNRRLFLPMASSESGKMKDDFGHLLDFVQNLKKLKIAPPAEELFAIREPGQLTFDLSLMKSITVLFVDSICMHQFQGRHQFPGQLQALEVRRTIASLKEILVVFSPSDVEYCDEASMFEAPPNYVPKPMPKPKPSLSEPDYSRALRWNYLRHANFKLNQLTKIDDSLKLLPYLEKLDLSFNYIEDIENLTELPHLRVLDLSRNKISDLSNLHKKMGNVKKLSLSSNSIISLEGVEKTFSLEYFDLGNNHISDVAEVGRLSRLANLNYLILQGNPLEQSPSYRSQVFSQLPKTDERVALDGKKASIDEQYISISLNTPTLGHKRVPSRTADISLDTDEQETKEAASEVEEGMSLTNQLEELRKEGGDKWLAILNADKKKSENEVVSLRRSPTKKKRKSTKTHRDKKRTTPEASLNVEASLVDLEVSMSPTMAQMVAAKQETDSPQNLTTSINFLVTVHEYVGSLQTFSTGDMDQLLLNCRLEEATVSVDPTVNKILEVVMAANRTRAQRDLALLMNMKVHEGKRLALCLQFMTLGSSSMWVVYCVPTMDALVRMYSCVRATMRSRSTTPEASLALLEITSIVSPQSPTSPPSDTLSPKLEITESMSSAEQTFSLSDIKDGRPALSLESTNSKGSTQSSLNLTQSPNSSLKQNSSLDSDILTIESSIKPLSNCSTPTSRKSPIHLNERSVTPEPNVQYHQEVRRDRQDETAISSAVEISRASRDFLESGVFDPPPGQDLIPSKNVTPKTVKKPGLENEQLANFFSGLVASDCSEVIVSVVWGGCCITSSPSCEIETGLIVSDKAVYLMEVLDPCKHKTRNLSWETDNLPLACIMSCPLATVTRVATGVFDQSVCLEFIEKGLLKSFALLPRKYDQMVAITENIKAVMDNLKIYHCVMTTRETIIAPQQADGALFVTSDSSDLLRLKEDLIWPKTIAQVGNFIAVTSKSETVLASHFETEVKRISEDQAQKFEIVQHVMVGEICTDVLPLSIGQPHLRTRTLILTNDTIYLCIESLLSWPQGGSIKFPLPRTVVLDSHPLKFVSKIKICDRAQHVVAHADPVYEFVIKFEVVNEVPGTEKSVFRWKLCVQDRECLDQFMVNLTNFSKDLRQEELKTVHATDSITDTLSLQPVSKSRKISVPKVNGGKSRNPVFFQSEVLLDFAKQSNYQRGKFFKKHVAQAEFIKSDEIPLCTFLAHCSTSSPTQDHIEIEVCLLTSNYAIYLLSDVDSIRKWMDDGGAFSFQRMSLLSKKDSSDVRCFHRIWLSEVKEIKLGLFHLSATISYAPAKSSSPSPSITIHTDNQFATVSLLSSLSCTLNLQNSAEEEEISDLDFCDLVSESVAAQKIKKGSKMDVECIPHPDISIDKLKEILISISPSITRNSSMENITMSMHVLSAQVMLLVEELHIRDTVSVQAKPHLVHLTNYGLYVCRNAKDEYYSPSVAAPSDLRVKKWCHIDLIEHLSIKLPSPPAFVNHTLYVSIRTPQATMSTKDSGMTFLVQNSELLHFFVHLLSNLWSVRTGKYLPINTR